MKYVLLFLLVVPAVAQLGTPADYRQRLDKMHNSIQTCQNLMTVIRPEDFNVEYKLGKEIDDKRKSVSESISSIYELESSARSKDTLKNDIMIEEMLSDLTVQLEEFAFILSQHSIGVWVQLDSFHSDIMKITSSMRHHLVAHAQELEDKIN